MSSYNEKSKAFHRKHLSSGGRTKDGCEVCLSKGGDVEQAKKNHQMEKTVQQYKELQAKRGESYGNESKGVHSPSYSSGRDRGQSIAGDNVRGTPYYKGAERKAAAKGEHERVLGEIKADKTDRRNLAKGGEVEDRQSSSDDETLAHGCAKEAIAAFHSKDHKKLISSMKALMPYLKD